jgi:hypothetical protein
MCINPLAGKLARSRPQSYHAGSVISCWNGSQLRSVFLKDILSQETISGIVGGANFVRHHRNGSGRIHPKRWQRGNETRSQDRSATKEKT